MTELGSKRNEGAALLISVVLLFVVSAVALSTLQTTESDQKVAGYQKQEQVAFYAAEAGLAEARELVRQMASRTEKPEYPADFPDDSAPGEISTATDHGNVGRPKFYADPEVSDPIGYLGEGAPCTEGCDMTIGSTRYNHTRWRISVVGESASGDSQRIELIALRLLATGY
jgi:hypothetical protein